MDGERPRVRKWYERERVCSNPGVRSRTKQSFKEEVNINRIVARWQKQGVLPPVNARRPRFGDFTEAADFRSMMEAVHAAEASFASLPAAVRKRVDNDPAAFVEFYMDPASEGELLEMGLIGPRKEAAKSPPESPPGGPGGEESKPVEGSDKDAT